MSDPVEMARDLRAHLALCEELLLMVERENQSLRTASDSSQAFAFFQYRKQLLPRLDESLGRLKQHRMNWQRLPPAARQQNPEVASLLRLNQDLSMKIIFLDRENEQALLRRGMLPPNQLPPANRQRPHFVSDLYRRHSRQ
jgi:uncharacterized protein YaaN involved in tellurite resistance